MEGGVLEEGVTAGVKKLYGIGSLYNTILREFK
jgi:hypothetical protein